LRGRTAWFFALLGAAIFALTACQEAAVPSIDIVDAWARPTMPGQGAGVVYLIITNDGAIDRLVDVDSDIAGDATIHLSETVDGVARMRAMTAVAIPTDVPVRFAPGGLHIMLTDLAHPLILDDQFELSLTFESSGEQRVVVEVKPGGDWELRPDDEAIEE